MNTLYKSGNETACDMRNGYSPAPLAIVLGIGYDFDIDSQETKAN